MRSRCSTLLAHVLILLLILLILPLLRGIRPKDLVNLVDLLLRDDVVTQVLRMWLAGVSLGNQSQKNTHSLANLH